MFDWLKDKFKDETPNVETPEILGLRLGGAFELDQLKLKLIEPELTIEGAAKTQLIQAVGEVKLDDQTRLLRFYTDDDGYIQVLQNGPSENDIAEVKLVYFFGTSAIDTDEQWQRLLDHELVQATKTLDGQVFHKAWDNIKPVAMTETTWQMDKHASETDQFVMIYERELSSGLFEGLMVSGEEKCIHDQPERCVVTSTFFDLTPTDFKVIG